MEWTRDITVHTTAERVWPWLAQMGYGRGGWHTPQWVHLFANRWVFGQRTPFPARALTGCFPNISSWPWGHCLPAVPQTDRLADTWLGQMRNRRRHSFYGWAWPFIPSEWPAVGPS